MREQTVDGALSWGRQRGLRLTAFALLLSSCNSLEPLRTVNPEISEFGAVVYAREHGVIDIFATPANPSFRLPRRHRVEMTVTTSGGDVERVALYRSWCPPHRPNGFYSCHSLIVSTRSGTVLDLESQIRRLGGRFGLMSQFSSTWAEVIFSEPNGLMERRRRLMDLPQVWEVALDTPGCVECGPAWINGVQAALAAAIPLDVGIPVVGDGFVQYAPGDTVILRYSNPGGAEIVRSYLTAAP